MQDTTREFGPQPVDAIMARWNLSNHQWVETSPEQLNHKQIQRARSGRRLTLHMMQKLTRTLNEILLERLPKEQREQFVPYSHKHLFNYSKGHDPAWQDPNEALLPNPP